MKDKDFVIKFENLRGWIRNSVKDFSGDTLEKKAERIAKAKEDKIFFAKTYFPHYISDDFAPVHTELFELSDIYNKPVVVAGAREVAKSTIISFFDELHKTLYKLNKFTVFISDTRETAATEFLLPIRAELEANPRIIADFGEQKSDYWGLEDFVTLSGKRFLSLGPRQGGKGKRNKGSRIDRVIVEDFENLNSSRKKSIIKRRLKYLMSDIMKSTNFRKWQFIFVGNYFSKKTIIHTLLTSDDYKNWERRIYPAIIDVKGKQKSIWEARMPLKKLLEEQADDPVTFRTERMQKPDDDEAKFKEEWFQKFDMKDISDSKGELRLPVVTYHDPAAGKGEEHCYKATVSLAVDKKNADYYVIHAYINKDSKFRNIQKHFDISKEFHSVADGVESNGYQLSLKEDYEREEKHRGIRLNLKLIHHRESKEVRILRLESPIERGHIKFLRVPGYTGVNMLIDQLLDYPDGDDIDGPDALSGAIEVADQVILKKKNKLKAKVF